MKKDSYSKYRDNLAIFDQCFGIYFTAVVIEAFVFYFQSKTSLMSCVLMILFLVGNLLISRLVASSEKPTLLESCRLYVFNGIISISLFYYSTGAHAHFWPALLVGSVTGSIFILGITSKRTLAYAQMTIWLGFFAIANWLLGEMAMDWSRWFSLASVMVMVAALMTEVVHALTIMVEKESETRAQLFQASKLNSLGEMAAGIAHEVNNPLAIISSTVRIARKMIQQKKSGSEEFEELLTTIDSTVGRITKIVLGLRNLSRDSSNEDFEVCTFRECISDVLALSSAKFKSRGVSLDVDISETVNSEELRVMRVQLSQVFLNILLNAYDAIENLPEKWVKIQAERVGDSIVVRITDSGKGIPLEVQQKIFQPFFTTKEIGKGTGLGLSLSNAIIAKHGGKFSVDNSSKNTCFVVALPKDLRQRPASKKQAAD